MEKLKELVIKAKVTRNELVKQYNELVDEANKNAEKFKEQVIKLKGSRNEIVGKTMNWLTRKKKQTNN